MAVTFIIGRAGSGKTQQCAARIAGALAAQPLGPRIYWLLPKQATFIAERQLACGMKLPGFCRARVLSFEQFADDIFNDCGGSSIPEITSLGRQMALGHLLRKHEEKLRFFRSVARQPGLAAELDATLAELERSGCDPKDMLAAVESDDRPADPEAIALRDKLADLDLLSTAYGQFLGMERLDQHARLEQVLKKIGQCSFIADAIFYVDDFAEFTDAERKMLVAIGRSAASLRITLTIDPTSPTVRDFGVLPGELSAFHRTEMTYHRLRAAFEKERIPAAVELLERAIRFETPATRTVERLAFADDIRAGVCDPGFQSVGKTTGVTDPGSDSASATQGLMLVEAPTRAAEVDAAAREIGRLVAEENLRYRDIAVIVRSMDPYLGLLDAAFAEHRIPWFADRRRTAGHHPLLQLLRSLFQIVRFDWPHDAVMSMLKGGLSGVDGAAADAIENYVLRHGLVGSAWTAAEPWNYQQQILQPEDADDSPRPADTPATIDAIRRRLVAAIDPFASAFNNRGQSRAIFTKEPRTERTRGVSGHPTTPLTLTSRVRSVRGSSELDGGIAQGHPAAPGGRGGQGRQELTVRQIAAETFACLERLGARQELQRWMETDTAAGNFEQAGEHEQVWANLVDLFEQMVDLLGDEPMGLDDFVVVLESGLEQFDLALAPATVDQVLIGQVDRTHTPAIKACLVLGLANGEFPAVARDPTVLSDRERRSLAKRLIELSPGTRRQQLDEFFLGYAAFTRASHFLWISRPTSIAGREAAPSEFWRRLRKLFPNLQPRQAPDPGQVDADAIATPRQLITGVMRWARKSAAMDSSFSRRPGSPRTGETAERGDQARRLNELTDETTPNAIWPALYTLLADHPPTDDAIDVMRFRAWKALAYDNSARISPAAADRLFPRPLPVSVTQLETFAACPYQHFVRFGLRLQPRLERQVGGRELSNAYHDLLGKLIDLSIDKAGGAMRPIAPQTVKIEADRLARRLAQELFTGNGRNAYLLRTIERSTQRIVASQQAVLACGKCRPAQTSVTFGPDGQFPAVGIDTPRGQRAMLHGRIDRIDSADGVRAVIDYRLSARGLDLEQTYYGLSLRLLANLLAMDVCFGAEDAGTPRLPAALELPLLRRLQRVNDPADAPAADTPEFLLAQPPKGIVAKDAARQFDSAWTAGKSDVLGAYIKKDGAMGKSGILMDEDRLADLLRFAWLKIGELADEILGGRIEANPYRLRDHSPCSRCEFRSICRFDSGINRYHSLKVITTDELWQTIEAKAADDV